MSAPPAPTSSPHSGGAIASALNSTSDGCSSRAAPGSGSSGAPSSPQSPAPPPGTPGCAACKHKRQKCPPGCVLLPYFPADDPDRFRSVLRVFGVKNLLRTLREVPRPRWDACVRTIVYESRMRLMDPVRGCVGLIEDLEAQLMDAAVELEVLRRRLEEYRLGKRSGLLLHHQPPNPHGGRTASPRPRGLTDLDPARQRSGRRTLDETMQPQGPNVLTAWPPAATGLSPTRPRLSLTEPQFPAAQPQFSATPPQLSAWPPAATGLSATPPQLSAWPPVAAGLTATLPQLPVMPPLLPAATQPQFSPTPPQFSAMQPQPAMRRQPTRRATATIREDFGNARANDERGRPQSQ